MTTRPSEHTIFTVGHSTHSLDKFVNLIQQHDIAIVADVRSTPYSRHHPHFNQEKLRASLSSYSIDYVPLGKELGGRIENRSCYINGQIQYPLVARTDTFNEGLSRLKEGIKRFRVAVMCAEQEPTDCHRFLLISRALVESGVHVRHIYTDGSAQGHDVVLDRLRTKLKITQLDLFSMNSDVSSEMIDRTYTEQANRVAFVETDASKPENEVR